MTAKSDRRQVLEVPAKPGVPTERQLADIALDPIAGGAVIAASFSKGMFGESDLVSVVEALHDRGKAVRGNKLGSVEDMLVGQAAALNAIFLELTRRAGANLGEYIQAAETYLRLALKAQAQCRATLETLANIKNPPVVYARQANIAHGPQQVNNDAASPASDPASPPNELLETEDGKRLDPGTTGAAIGSDPGLEAVGAIDGAKNDGRQGKRQPQRRPRREAAGAKG